MPELPEVETIRRDLEPRVVGKRLLGYGLVKGFGRVGKIMFFELDGKYLLVHLKMTGQLIYVDGDEVLPGGHEGPDINKYTRKVLKFDDGSKILFNDVRRFGYIKVVKELPVLGREPIEDGFSLEGILRNRTASIKSLLLNQALVAGIGNIYVDEICFGAGVRPQRKVNRLSKGEIKKLERYSKSILKRAIEYRGTTFSDYRDGKGKKGGFQRLLKVYGRSGEVCKKCKDKKIKKIRVAARGTHYCPNCQK